MLKPNDIFANFWLTKKNEIQHSTAIVINKSTKYVLHSMKYKLKCYVGKSVIHKNSLDGWKL